MTAKPLTLALAAMAVCGAASAQTPPAPAGPPRAPPPPRARGPSLATAVPAAQAAVATCLANGYKVTALIADSTGDPVVLLSGDGVFLRTQTIVKTKVAAVIKYRMSSGEVMAKALTDPKLDAELKANPDIGVIRQGAVPIMSGAEMIGAFGVSGAPGGEKDEACIAAALAKYPQK
jgi:uncharacterized protein GlcG (DUF336 family)